MAKQTFEDFEREVYALVDEDALVVLEIDLRAYWREEYTPEEIAELAGDLEGDDFI